MDKSDFRILVRRVPGYEPAAAVRFEMREGYGELHIGERKRASPAAQGEISEAPGEQVRMGRFVHVLSSGKRRQSYSLSRLDDERLQRLSEEKWIELVPITEFGIRYLDLPVASEDGVAAVQVSANPTPTRGSAPNASAASTTATGASSGLLARARSSSNRQRRASPAAPVSRERTNTPVRGTSANPAATRTATPRPRAATADSPPPRVPASRPPPVARVDQDAPTVQLDVPPSMGIEPGLGADAVASLSVDELRSRLIVEMEKVANLHAEVGDLHRLLDESKEREADLVKLIARWSKRG